LTGQEKGDLLIQVTA